jgi:hypothetical protein
MDIGSVLVLANPAPPSSLGGTNIYAHWRRQSSRGNDGLRNGIGCRIGSAQVRVLERNSPGN